MTDPRAFIQMMIVVTSANSGPVAARARNEVIKAAFEREAEG